MAKRKPMKEWLVTCDIELRGAIVPVMGRDEAEARAAFNAMDWVDGADTSVAETVNWKLTDIEPNE